MSPPLGSIWHWPHFIVPLGGPMPNFVRWATCSEPRGVGLPGSSKNRGWQVSQPPWPVSSYVGYASTRTTPATSARPTRSVRRYLSRVPSIWIPRSVWSSSTRTAWSAAVGSDSDYYRPHDEYVNQKWADHEMRPRSAGGLSFPPAPLSSPIAPNGRASDPRRCALAVA